MQGGLALFFFGNLYLNQGAYVNAEIEFSAVNCWRNR